jgi:hypothetical protein
MRSKAFTRFCRTIPKYSKCHMRKEKMDRRIWK